MHTSLATQGPSDVLLYTVLSTRAHALPCRTLSRNARHASEQWQKPRSRWSYPGSRRWRASGSPLPPKDDTRPCPHIRSWREPMQTMPSSEAQSCPSTWQIPPRSKSRRALCTGPRACPRSGNGCRHGAASCVRSAVSAASVASKVANAQRQLVNSMLFKSGTSREILSSSL